MIRQTGLVPANRIGFQKSIPLTLNLMVLKVFIPSPGPFSIVNTVNSQSHVFGNVYQAAFVHKEINTPHTTHHTQMMFCNTTNVLLT